MKKVFIFIYIFILIIFLKLVITFSMNELFIHKYNNEEYDKNLVKSLFVLNFSERYIAYYNYGNYFYKIGYYEDAIEEYNKALELNPPKDRVCDIRVNLALSMVNSVDPNADAEVQLKALKAAREVLYVDNCAEEDDVTEKEESEEQEEEEQGGSGEQQEGEESGSGLIIEPNTGGESEEAEDLEGEILEKENDIIINSGGSSGDGESEEDKEEQKKQEELEDRNESAGQNRQEELDQMEDYDNYKYYDGKKW